MEYDSNSARYGEWTILKDGITEFTGFLRRYRAVNPRTRVSAVGYGSPRSHRLAITFSHNGKAICKVIRIDVRDGDWREWISKFDAADWQQREG